MKFITIGNLCTFCFTEAECKLGSIHPFMPCGAMRTLCLSAFLAGLCRRLGIPLCKSKVGEFHFLRLANALACGVAEIGLALSIDRDFGNLSPGNRYLLFSAVSAGMFYSSPSLLPSSFAMTQIICAYSCWLLKKDLLVILFFTNAALLGWPFTGLLAIPLMFRMLARRRFARLLLYGGLVSGTLSFFVYLIDSYFYGRPVIAPLRLVLYNVFPSEGRGPDVFGREPWFYYLINGNLNFPVFFALALFYGLYLVGSACAGLLGFSRVIPVRKSTRNGSELVFATSMLIWLVVLSCQPHKEERFLYPIYPIVCLLAAECCYRCARLLGDASVLRGFLVTFCVVSSVIFNLSRIAAQQHYYSAPIAVFEQFVKRKCTLPMCTLCMGREWHRFPSSFFLPNRTTLRFIPYADSGLLPRPFESTSSIPKGMNDMNIAVYDDRYVTDVARECDFFIDVVDHPSAMPMPLKTWSMVADAHFLDRDSARSLHRIFYIPGISAKLPRHRYILLERSYLQES
ncbi:mannosyltransferase [Cyanidiococcus yangmingshanensis]|uniref:Mannosyltransferase n=1 Tax=Cyanidiococcus yangmingshanensis TaxID=2690220 RepID=A0A7J7IP73_9RHOD|nr:mannosyltransferase [Cyanidiococcus yangmingshanensis]